MEKNHAEIDLNEEEICADCGIGLGYPKSTPIGERPCYTEGIGDRCSICFRINQLIVQIAELSNELERLRQLKTKPKLS